MPRNFSEMKSGGDYSYAVPHTLKSGGTRPPVPHRSTPVFVAFYCYCKIVDYSSAFNTVIPQQLYDKFQLLSLDPSMCYWILDFLLQRSQVVKMSSRVSSTIIMKTGTPQGCVLSPLLYSLSTNDCVSHHSSVPLLKCADDTTLIGLVSDSDESEYRHEVSSLVSWCDTNNLQLNASKTREMIVDFRNRTNPLAPIIVNGDSIESVDCF